jgi:YidC/Oxa1 family membrane protein insertase
MLNREKYLYDGPTTITLAGGETGEIVFKYKDVEKNLSVFKKYFVSNGSYIVGLDYELVKNGRELQDVPFIFGPDLENNISEARVIQGDVKILTYDGRDTSDLQFSSVKTVKTGDSTIENAEGTLGSNFIWAAYDRAYFTAIFKTSPRNSVIRFSTYKETTTAWEGEEGKEQKEKKKTDFYSYMEVTNPGLVYLGPKDEEVLDAVTALIPNADEVIDYGFLGGIARILLKGVNLVHSFIPNYGWAIVVFTIFLKILLFPLTYTSSVSMAKMQALQPKIKAIKKKYKNMRDPDQRKKMNTETMELYKREKVNPASGCLPMLLQLPILFGFFSLLRTCINVRHEPWILWITDLSIKDPIYLLPILMGATQILLQKMTPSTAEGAQKKMMYLMPIIIVIFVINLPSGLTLYWFTSNILQIGQQVIINKRIYQQKKDEEKMKKAQKRKKGGKGK